MGPLFNSQFTIFPFAIRNQSFAKKNVFLHQNFKYAEKVRHIIPFEKDPVGTVKELAGNIPPEQIQPVVDGIKTKISLDKLGGIGGGLGGLFGKK